MKFTPTMSGIIYGDDDMITSFLINDKQMERKSAQDFYQYVGQRRLLSAANSSLLNHLQQLTRLR